MAGRIPQSFINDLLARVDIVDVIDRRVPLRKAGKDYKARCPFHDEKTPSFTVSQQKQLYHCFGCGVSGSALTFLMEFERLEFVPAVEALAAIAGVEVPREAGAAVNQPDMRCFEVMERAEKFFRGALKAHAEAVDYLKGRGVTGITARDFGIGYAPPGWNQIAQALPDVPEPMLLELGLLTKNETGRVYDKFRDRVMFPIRDTRGRVVGFGGRVLGGDDGPKYLNSPETPIFHKGQELYGLYEARKSVRRLERLIVVEGYLDVVSMSQAGIPMCVAALGTAISTEQMRKLFRYVDDVVCCFDGDRAGRQAAWRALEASLSVLADGKRLQFVFLPEGEDPDSFVRKQGKDAFLTQLQGATPVIEYLFSTLAQGLNLNNLDDRARLASLAMPYIERVQEGILRQLMQGHLQRLTGSRAPDSPAPVIPVLQGTGAQGQPPGRQAGRGTIARQTAVSRLEERLLAILLRYPQVGVDVSLPAGQDGAEPLATMVDYVRRHPDATTEELLALWMGEAQYDRLAALAGRSLMVEDEALVGTEFREGLLQLGQLRQRVARKALLSTLQGDPNRENLSRLLSARTDKDEYREEKDREEKGREA